MIAVAYYTVGGGTSYEAEAELLRRSMKVMQIPHEIDAIPDRGDWYANTAAKAEFIREKREKHQGALVYVDVDAFWHRKVDRFFDVLNHQRIDFAAHWFAGPAKGHRRHQVCSCVTTGRCDRPHRMLSGTLFFGDSDGARRLLDAWVTMNRTLAGQGIRQGGGQKNLWFLTTCFEPTALRVDRLPWPMCYVFDKPWAYPNDGDRPAIEHTIASRDHRAERRRTTPRADRIAQLWAEVEEREKRVAERTR